MKPVYVVEDDASVREMLSHFLSRERYEVASFASPAQALTYIAADPPALIVSDVQMPGMDGFEFLAKVRAWGCTVPAILITANRTPEVERRASGLGVHHIVDKPIRNLAGLAALIGAAVAEAEAAPFETLRLEFLTGMSHELRTPLTAVKLALDGLFARPPSGLDPEERRLMAIGRRNVDRMIRVVERRLDLLQIALGDVAVARRLVDLRDVADRAFGDCGGPSRVGPGTPTRPRTPAFVFTDPDRLQTVIQYVAAGDGRGEDYGGEPARYGLSPAGEDIVMTFEGSVGGAGGANRSFDFEFRACQRIMKALGGAIEVDRAGARHAARLHIPILPAYDRRSDFILPVKSLRKAATLGGRSVSIIRCELPGGVKTGNGGGPAASYDEFFSRCDTVLSDGDALVRGKDERTFYLVLIERKRDETDRITEFLRQGSGPVGEDVDAVLLQQLLPGEHYPEDLILDLESAK